MLSAEEAELLHVLPGPLIAAGAEGKILFMNPAAADLLGYEDPRALVGRPLTDLMPARMVEQHRKGFQRYLRTGQSKLLGRRVRVPARTKTGEEKPIDLRIRMFRRPDGTDLIVAAMGMADPKESVIDLAVARLEKTLVERAYQLI